MVTNKDTKQITAIFAMILVIFAPLGIFFTL